MKSQKRSTISHEEARLPDKDYKRLKKARSEGGTKTVIALSKTGPGFASSYVEDLMIMDGRGSPPGGFHKLDVDLNEGAGGAYLYLCYKDAGGREFSHIAIEGGEDASTPSAPSNQYHLVKDQHGEVCDLNRGAGGDYLWLSYAFLVSSPVIDRIGVVSASDPDDIDRLIPPGFIKYPVELNEKAGGNWIYIIYEQRPTNPTKNGPNGIG